MALSGSLKEFALPDIFQLIGQQKKSGRLLLRDQGKEGFVIFSGGMIIDAGTATENLISILVNYLLYHKGYPQKKISEFINYCKGNTKILCDVLVRIQYVSEDELFTLAQITLEDLACSLFTWTKGNYQFLPMEKAENYCIGGIAYSPDAITMEAMRRLDEWNRMKDVINEDSVFVPVRDAGQQPVPPDSPVLDPRSHILSQLTGTASVSELGTNTFFSNYRIFEVLFLALQNGEIIQVPAEQVKAAMKQEHEQKHAAQETTQTTVSVLVSTVVFILLFISGYILLPGVLLAEKSTDAHIYARKAAVNRACNQANIAATVYTARHGRIPESFSELENDNLLSQKKIKILKKAKISFYDIR
ncbi:MAG: DUF4388 domain-containing protein [Chitinivibrionales bacterium]|nr:DUF4388 domain-containing protein [Chitinivibrionales bacterium]